MKTEKKTVGRHPLCGGSVVKTCKGHRYEYSIGDNPSRVLNTNGVTDNRKMDDGEVVELLEKCHILLDGFVTKEDKTFLAIFELANDGAVNMRPIIGKCLHCGENIRVGSQAFNCSNYGNQGKPCSLVTWRNVGGHRITLAEATDICEKDTIASELEMYRDDGSIYRKRLGLAPDKLQIVKV